MFERLRQHWAERRLQQEEASELRLQEFTESRWYKAACILEIDYGFSEIGAEDVIDLWGVSHVLRRAKQKRPICGKSYASKS